jgi:hypothetical protein
MLMLRPLFFGYVLISFKVNILKALLDKYPEYVVKRYESHRFAINVECYAIYHQALERLRRVVPQSSHSLPPPSPPPPPPPAMSENQSGFPGGKGNPVHVVVDEGQPSMSNEVLTHQGQGRQP